MMENDSKLGLFAGIIVLLVVAVFFHQKSIVGPAMIGLENGNGIGNSTQSAALPNLPAGAAGQNNQSNPAQPNAASGQTANVAQSNNLLTHWQPAPPRENQPVSRDPLLWP